MEVALVKIKQETNGPDKEGGSYIYILTIRRQICESMHAK